MKNFLVLLGVALGLGSSQALANPLFQLDPKFGKWVEGCAPSEANPDVILIKQWHVDASVDTKSTPQKDAPQTENQKAIFDLALSLSPKPIAVYAVEGCEGGELAAVPSIRFNGWDLESLKQESKKPSFNSLLTSIPLKIKARLGDQVSAYCIDNQELIKKTLLTYSNIRGTLGFLTRIDEFKDNPTKLKLYLDGVLELYKLSPTTDYKAARARLVEELKNRSSQVEADSLARDQWLAGSLLKMKSKPMIFVVGGLHTKNITQILNDKKMSCAVIEPKGYPAAGAGTEEALLKRLQEKIKGL